MLVKAGQGDMWSRVARLRDNGFAPSQVTDVGAYDGLWSRRAHALFPTASFMLIEALEAKRIQLERVCEKLGDAQLVIGVAAREAGTVVSFHQMETGSSMFPDLSSLPRTTAERTTVTLDEVLAGAGVAAVDFLKIDTQGAELEVLRGGAAALDTASIVLLELSVERANDGAPHADEVIAFMRDRGYQLQDIADVKRLAPGAAVHQFDAFFARDSRYFSSA